MTTEEERTMTEQNAPGGDVGRDDAQRAEWHRRTAVERFNRTWDLLDQETLTADEQDDLIEAAFTSRFHWGVVGGPSQWCVGDGQIARVAARVGLGELAVRYARRALAIAESEGWTDFHLVSGWEVLARAWAAVGDVEARAEALAKARAALEAIEDEEDRALLADQIATVPEVST
jgi:hypothetical protein